MQITRHWRLNSQRYRLQGIRYEDGKVSLQARPTLFSDGHKPEQTEVKAQQKQPTIITAA